MDEATQGSTEARASGGGRHGPISQKEGVYEAIVAVKGTSEFNGAVTLSDDERTLVREALRDGFKRGEIAYAGDLPDDKELFTYTSGLVSNWLRKDTRLSGGVKYTPKHPGIRAGSGDESIKAMKSLLTTVTDPAEKLEIQKAIDARTAELKPQPKPIKVEALPEHLRKYLH